MPDQGGGLVRAYEYHIYAVLTSTSTRTLVHNMEKDKNPKSLNFWSASYEKSRTCAKNSGFWIPCHAQDFPTDTPY